MLCLVAVTIAFALANLSASDPSEVAAPRGWLSDSLTEGITAARDRFGRTEPAGAGAALFEASSCGAGAAAFVAPETGAPDEAMDPGPRGIVPGTSTIDTLQLRLPLLIGTGLHGMVVISPLLCIASTRQPSGIYIPFAHGRCGRSRTYP